jgi:multiple sugar transport system permease protein
MRNHTDTVKVIEILFLSLGSIIMLFPFIWMISTSFKIPSQIISYPPTLIPRPPTLEYYTQIFTKLNFGRFFLNSGYISAIVTTTALLTSSFVGYVFAKYNFFGKEFIFIMILSTMMIPFAVTMIPLYLIISKLGWVNSHLALIIPGLYSTFGIFLMRQFMTTIPNELREAAIVDGCNEFRTFWSIILPQCKPALAALGIFTFMWNWDSFLWPLIVLTSEEKFTLPVGLAMFSQQWWTNYGLVMAGATVTVIPILIVFFIFQRQFIQGIVLTGLKM